MITVAKIKYTLFIFLDLVLKHAAAQQKIIASICFENVDILIRG